MPLKKYDFVSWDDEFPNSPGSHKIHVPNHQPVMELIAIISNFSIVFQTTNQCLIIFG